MKNKQEGLDKLIDEVLNASSADQEEVNRMAESPFLYGRLRAQIKEEKRLQSETSNFWDEIFFSFKLAAKVMTVFALIVIGFFVLQPQPKSHIDEEQASAEQIQTQPADVAELSNEELFAETIGLQNDLKLSDEVKR